METEEFDRNVDEADEEPIESSETGIADPEETDESETTGSEETTEVDEDRGDE
jgi:hypothetical protein